MTPVVAVLRELKKSHPRVKVRFWCDKTFAAQARSIINNFDTSIPVQTIFAGKLRRYHHLTVLRQLLWPSLVLSNLKDGFLVLLGFVQSFIKLIFWRPDVVFAKGGYVCLPVGFAAYLLRIPLVIHDSDAHPGLTNRLLSRFASRIATGAPLEYYPYSAKKSRYVGIPISNDFHRFDDKERRQARDNWGIRQDRPLVVVTGGGLGASRLNDAIITTLNEWQRIGSLVLISGAGQYDELRAITPPNDDSFQLHPFVSKNMASLLGAADVVVSRAGATTILELAALARPTVLIPNRKLTGGHQIKNAAVYSEKQAVLVVDEDELEERPKILVKTVKQLIENPSESRKMADRLAGFARPDAAREVAGMIINSIKRR